MNPFAFRRCTFSFPLFAFSLFAFDLLPSTFCLRPFAFYLDLPPSTLALSPSTFAFSLFPLILLTLIHVVLVHPEIHWNTGNAGRTCLAAGATLHLIEPLGFSLD